LDEVQRFTPNVGLGAEPQHFFCVDIFRITYPQSFITKTELCLIFPYFGFIKKHPPYMVVWIY